MKKIYNITKGQLATLWLFVIVFAINAGESYNDLLESLSITLFFVVVFYTIGWRNHNKKNSS